MKRFLFLFLCVALPALCLAAPQYKTAAFKESRPAAGQKPGYKLVAEYPVFAAPMPTAANAAAKAVASKPVEAFKKDYATDAQGNIAWDLDLHFTVEYSNADVISLLFSYSIYQGGAHPGHVSQAVMLSPKTGKTMTLAHCFRPGTPWLKTLSTYCIKKLKEDKDLQASEIENGAAAKAENYGTVLPTAKGLQVYFDEYQVGPYAAGPHEVEVPYSVVKSFIAPDGPLRAFR